MAAGSLFNFAAFDGLRPEDISGFASERFADLIKNPTRLGERILPFVKRDDWTEEVGRLSFRPVASSIIGPDSVLPRRPLGTFDMRELSILKGGAKYTLAETELKKLREVFHPGAKPTPEQIFRSRPYNMANALVTGYLDRAEQMRWEALSTGQYVIPGGTAGNGGIVDYGLSSDHKVTITTAGDKWNVPATADGLADILEWDAQLEESTGSHATMIVMSTKQLNNLLAQAAVREKLAVAGYMGIGGQVTLQATQVKMEFFASQLNAYLAQRGIGPVVTYDRSFNKYEDYGNTQPVVTRYLDADTVVMIAPTPIDGGLGFDGGTSVGYQVDGPVVENDFAPGLYVWMAQHDEPFVVEVKSVFWTLPILADPRTLLNAVVQ